MKRLFSIITLLVAFAAFGQANGSKTDAPATADVDSILVLTPQKRINHIPYTALQNKLQGYFDQFYLTSADLGNYAVLNGSNTFSYTYQNYVRWLQSGDERLKITIPTTGSHGAFIDAPRGLKISTPLGTQYDLTFGGEIDLEDYGLGNIAGTPTYALGVDTDGNVIEFDVPAGGGTISDEAYGGTWSGNTTEGASKNQIWNKIESVIAGSGATASTQTKSDFNGTTDDTWAVTVAPANGHALYAGSVYLVEGVHYTVSGNTITFTNPPDAGVTHTYYPNVVVNGDGTFTGLTDTPATYTADKWLKVNSAGTALEYTDAPTGIYRTSKVTITNPDMSGGAVETQIVAAQGANTVILVESVSWVASGISGGTGNQNITARWGGDTTDLVPTKILALSGTTNSFGDIPSNSPTIWNHTTGVNAALNIRLTSANLDSLTANIVCSVVYKVLDLTTGDYL